MGRHFSREEAEDRYYDEDVRRDSIRARRAHRSGGHCRCGNPDWPGQCPGWRNCPVHGTEDEDSDE